MLQRDQKGMLLVIYFLLKNLERIETNSNPCIALIRRIVCFFFFFKFFGGGS